MKNSRVFYFSPVLLRGPIAPVCRRLKFRILVQKCCIKTDLWCPPQFSEPKQYYYHVLVFPCRRSKEKSLGQNTAAVVTTRWAAAAAVARLYTRAGDVCAAAYRRRRGIQKFSNVGGVEDEIGFSIFQSWGGIRSCTTWKFQFLVSKKKTAIFHLELAIILCPTEHLKTPLKSSLNFLEEEGAAGFNIIVASNILKFQKFRNL